MEEKNKNEQEDIKMLVTQLMLGLTERDFNGFIKRTYMDGVRPRKVLESLIHDIAIYSNEDAVMPKYWEWEAPGYHAIRVYEKVLESDSAMTFLLWCSLDGCVHDVLSHKEALDEKTGTIIHSLEDVRNDQEFRYIADCYDAYRADMDIQGIPYQSFDDAMSWIDEYLATVYGHIIW